MILGRLCMATCAVGLSACSLLVDIDGLRTGTSLADGGALVADGNAPEKDATSDSAASDAPAESGYCAKRDGSPFLCEDFDGVTIDSRWKKSGAFAIEQGDSLVTPAYTSSTPTIEASAVADSSLSVTLPATPHVRLSWSVRKELTSCSNSNIAGVRFERGSEFYIVQIRSNASNELEFQYYALDSNRDPYQGGAPLGASTTPGQWKRFAMDVDLRTDHSVINITLDDAAKPSLENFKLAPKLAIATATPVAYVGLGFVESPSGPCKFRFDDVVVEQL